MSDDYRELRDSMFILATMDQFELKNALMDNNGTASKEFSSLLRMALFSKDLVIPPEAELAESSQETSPAGIVDIPKPRSAKRLQKMRRKLAMAIRARRHKAVVPLFISTLWFLFAVGLGILGGMFRCVPNCLRIRPLNDCQISVYLLMADTIFPLA